MSVSFCVATVSQIWHVVGPTVWGSQKKRWQKLRTVNPCLEPLPPPLRFRTGSGEDHGTDLEGQTSREGLDLAWIPFGLCVTADRGHRRQ